MSESNNTKRPSHVAYHVTERGDKSFWTRIGAGWQHADGNGFNIQLSLTPLDGRVSLRIASEKKDQADASEQAA